MPKTKDILFNADLNLVGRKTDWLIWRKDYVVLNGKLYHWLDKMIIMFDFNQRKAGKNV